MKDDLYKKYCILQDSISDQDFFHLFMTLIISLSSIKNWFFENINPALLDQDTQLKISASSQVILNFLLTDKGNPIILEPIDIKELDEEAIKAKIGLVVECLYDLCLDNGIIKND